MKSTLVSYRTDREAIQKAPFTFSIIIETENLGMAGIEDLQDTIASLEAQTYPLARAKEVIIIAAGHVQPETLAMIESKYPWLVIHKEPKKLEYTESKMCGAKVATSDIVVFADSDVVYDPTWLENLLYGFIACPGAGVTTGETRIRGRSIYAIAVQLWWMMNVVYCSAYPKQVQHFHLNNFAIKRALMVNTPFFLGLPIYRAMTVEWKKQIMYKGYGIMRVPGARGYHLPPGNIADWWYRMLVYGADAVAKADFYFLPNSVVMEKFSFFRRLSRIPLFFFFKMYTLCMRASVLIREDWENIFYILCALPLVIISAIVSMIGTITALFSRDFIYKKVTARETAHVV